MCLPAPALVGLATTALSTGLSIYQGQQSAQADKAAYRSNLAAAQRAQAIESASQQVGVEEERQRVSRELAANQQAVARAQGEAFARFGSSGVGGGALDAVVREYARQGGQAGADLSQSLRFAGANAEIQRRGTFERTVQDVRASKPRGGQLGLSIATNVLGGVQTGLGYIPT